MAGILDLDKLKRYAKEYDSVLRTLPYFTFQEFAAAMKLNVIEIDNEDVIVNARRKAGHTGPYKAGAEINYPDEVGKLVEMSIKPELTVSRLKDNILNYKEKKILSNAGERVDHTTKKHPLEKFVVDNHIVSHSEDVTFSAFFAERNDSVFSPMTSFTGFFPWIDHFKTTNDITMANHNLVRTGVFGGEDGKNDYDRLIDFLRAAHPFLRRKAILYYATEIELICKEAYRQKVKAFARPTSEEFWKAVKDDAKFPGLEPITHEAYGTGQALILIRPGMMDFGVNTKKATSFVQIRDIFEDPNELQFWLQAGYGTRFQDIHPKVFQTNEFTNEGVDLAGDYVTGAAVTVTVGPDAAVEAGACWKLGESGEWMKNGQTLLGVPAGTHSIIYKDVEGYTKPANGSVTVEDGKDFTVSGTYTK
ncbi:hypothetical protein [Parabacteroides sp. AM08-6]|uniref:hypothetical protein n=1 Tax=Parabacteroides sp. AM08-6 TaxID=2292053 RepID=UPI000EFEB6BF|nr:hypothetical protein [Parabacteroides sp. AM08-6]RHJ83531.1 hypothetical protein DW103_07340 [Parabacteroides sp. AM08-6]